MYISADYLQTADNRQILSADYWYLQICKKYLSVALYLRIDAVLDLRHRVPRSLCLVVHLVREVLLRAASHRYSV